MRKILFIGTFFSTRTGTKSIAEKIKDSLSNELNIQLVSSIKNKPLRLFHILWTSLIFRGEKVNIDVFSDSAFIIANYASLVLQFRGKEIIITLRGGKLADFYKNNTTTFKKVVARASRVQTPSKYLQSFFKEQEIDVYYLPNPIQLDKFSYKPNPKPYHLLWVRAFTSIYNPDIPVKLVALLKDQFPTIKLTMIGPDKGLQAEIVKLIQELRLESNIDIIGPVPNEKLPEYYHNHSIFLNTTTYESFGTAVMEAASCGIPIVSTPVGEIPYLWKHGKNILLTTTVSAESFVTPVSQLLASKFISTSLRENARKIAEKFDWDTVIIEWNKILK